MIQWDQATPVALHALTVNFLRAELDARGLDSSGSKDDLVARLSSFLQDQKQQAPQPQIPAPQVLPPGIENGDTAQPTVTPVSSPDVMQLLASCLQQNTQLLAEMHSRPVQVATLPDLSSCISTFEDSKTTSTKRWLEELEKTKQLAAWTDSTLRAIAISKLRGTAKNWHLAAGHAHASWTDWKAALLQQFSDQLTLIEWQRRVMERLQTPTETLHQYTFAKLRLLARCPVLLTDQQRIEYIIQGIADRQVTNAIAAQCPPSVDAFIAIVTQLDNASLHVRRTRDPFTRDGNRNSDSRPPSAQMPGTSKGTSSPRDFQPSSSDRFPRRISHLPPAEREARYDAIAQRYNAPAYRSGQDIRDAVCFRCRNKGHLSAKCPEFQQSRPPPPPPAPSPRSDRTFTCKSGDSELSGSKIACAMVTADVRGIGHLDAFPDSGSSITLISAKHVSGLQLLPWTAAPLIVVGGGTITPIGSACLRISVDDISGVVEAAVLENNPLPLILGDDWLCAARAELHVKPPRLPEIHQPHRKLVPCVEKTLPRMANAVLLQETAIRTWHAAPTTPTGLQLEPILEDQKPLWTTLEVPATTPPPLIAPSQASHVATLCATATRQLVEPHEQPTPDSATPSSALPSSFVPLIGPSLDETDRNKIQAILNSHVPLFATDEQDLGLYMGTEHSIDLVHGATPYSRQPYRYSFDDRRFLERQTEYLLQKGIILPSSGPWAFPVVVVSQQTKKRLCVNYIPLNKMTVNVAQPLPRADDTIPDTGSHRYLLNLIDFASRYVVPAAVTSTSTKEVIAHLLQVFYRYGAADHCLTDHGRAFESHEFLRFMRLHGITIHHSVAYRAASNGLVERSNGTLVAVLRKLCKSDPQTWDTRLEEAAFAVNTTHNASSQFSPFALLHGYVPKMPHQKHQPKNTETMHERLLRLCADRTDALQRSEDAQLSRKAIYDRSHRDGRDFEPGDIVWIRRQQPVPDGMEKLSPRFKGLYEIVGKPTPVTFRVRQLPAFGNTNSANERTVHRSQVKKYSPPYVDPTLTDPHVGDVSAPSPTPLPDPTQQEPELPTLAPCPSINNLQDHSSSCETPAAESPRPTFRRPRRTRTLPLRLQDFDISTE